MNGGTRIKVYLILTFIVFLTCFFAIPVNGQKQFQIRQMRAEMASELETYSFGYSWDNQAAFDSLQQTYLNYQDLLTQKFLWKNRPGNSTERDFLRLLANYGISVIDNQLAKDPLIKLLLEYNPYLIPDNTDNIPDLNNHLKRFYPLPALKAGIKAGINYSITEESGNSYEIVQSPSTGKTYTADIGWQIAFPLSYLLTRNQSISFEPGISYLNLDITEEFLGNSQTFKYRIYYADVPLISRFNILNPKLGGFRNIDSYSETLEEKLNNRIISIKNKIEKSDIGRSAHLERRMDRLEIRRDHLSMNTPFRRIIPTIILGIKPKFRISSFVESDNANLLTNWVQLDAVAGIGFEWYGTRNTFSLEFRYNYGLWDTNTTDRYYLGGEVTGLLFNDFFVSDDFRIQGFEISFVTNYILNNKAIKIR